MSVDLPAGTHTVELAVADNYGILRGKRVPAWMWPTVEHHGVAMANVIFSWSPRCDIRDDDVWVGASDGWPDMHIVPIASTLRAVPWRPGAAMVLCEPQQPDGGEIPVSARLALQKVLARAADAGFEVKVGFEVEFYLVDAQTRRPREQTIECYGIARGSEYEQVLAPMRNQLVEFGVPVEASNCEFAPGQFEVNIRYGEAMHTADTAVLFRNAVKEIAAQHGYVASFMPKIFSDSSGSGLHLHQSLWRDGENVFSDGGKLSDLGRWYLGGLQKHLPELTLLGSPTPNAMKRRQPYSFCPLNDTWGIDNRTTALRAIQGEESAVRIEQRDGSAECNPYLVMAGQVAAGLKGIEERIEPSPRCEGDGYADESANLLPATIPDAIAALERSELAAEIFPELLLQTVIGSARYEHDWFVTRVSELERERYLDVF